MLCPKCGYITFDKLGACPKCRKDWSGIADKIGGTASSTDSFCFLGKVIGEEPEPEAAGYDTAADLTEQDETAVSLDGLPEIDLSGIENEESFQEAEAELDFSLADVGGREAEATMPKTEGQAGSGLDDIDLSDLVMSEKEADAGADETLDLDFGSLDIDNQQSGSSSIDLDLAGAENDVLNLSLDLDEEGGKAAKKKSDAEIPDLGLTLDLDQDDE
jgi:hypothetical protein